MKKFVIPQDVDLPPLSTDISARKYSFTDFLGEFVLMSEQMREDECLHHLFVIEELMSHKPGDEVELPDEALDAAKGASKKLIDERMNSNMLPPPWAMRVLRHYHALVTASK